MHPRVVNVAREGATWDVYVGRFPTPARDPNAAALTAERYMQRGPFRVHPRNLKRTVSLHNMWQVAENVYPILMDRKFPTVTTVGSRHDSKYCVVDRAGRRRQPEWTEAARAQGFPDDYVFVGNQTEAAQMVANAVQIDTGRAILRAIVDDWRARG
jgi:site-specific DNA-cytosine methylase